MIQNEKNEALKCKQSALVLQIVLCLDPSISTVLDISKMGGSGLGTRLVSCHVVGIIYNNCK